jgi:hypothetical protein
MLLCATVIGYPLAVAGNQISATELLAIHVGYPLAINAGFACLLLFTLRVFRAAARWAKGLVAATMLVLAACAVAYIRDATGEHPSGPTQMAGLAFVNSTAIAVAYFWTTFESLGYYRRLLLQVRLGLSRGGLVPNRVLLFGLMALSAGIAVLINAGAMLAGAFMSPPIVAISSALGLVHASCLFLAFHPPGWYRTWVEQQWVAQSA